MSKTITIPLDLLIQELLSDRDYVEISEVLALQIIALKSNGDNFYVQLPSDEFALNWSGTKIERPRLWNYKYWAQSVERHQASNRRSEKERALRFIFEYNTKIVSRAILKIVYITPEQANSLAQSMLRHGEFEKIKAMNVQVIERVDEIP